MLDLCCIYNRSYGGRGKTKGDKWSGILGMSFSLVLHLEIYVVILYLTIKHNRGFFGPASYHVRTMFGPCSVSFGYLSVIVRDGGGLFSTYITEERTKMVRRSYEENCPR